MSLQSGYISEQSARDYLVKEGLTWVTSNYRCRWGEIDIIMKDATHLIFVEVRARVSAEFGGAIESITLSKQRKIIKTATHYMVKNKLYDQCCARFDVISLQGTAPQLNWIKNAFSDGF
jgi:putative endonuclease